MKRTFLLTTVIFALFIAMPVLGAKAKASGPVKIGIIDVQKILRESKAAKKAQAVFMKDMETRRAQLIVKEKEIQALDEELKNAHVKLSDEIRKDKAEKLARDIKEFRRLDADAGEELKKMDVELTQKLLGEIRQIVQSFSKSEKYTLILEKNSVAAFDDSVDITDRIIRLYDAGRK
jgi:outer membrane protein